MNIYGAVKALIVIAQGFFDKPCPAENPTRFLDENS
jgi:hypothetical protein